MARTYSEDLRRRVVEDVEAGASRRAVAARYRVSVSFVVKLVSRWRAAGTLKPRRVGGAKLHALAPHLELVQGNDLLGEVAEVHDIDQDWLDIFRDHAVQQIAGPALEADGTREAGSPPSLSSSARQG